MCDSPSPLPLAVFRQLKRIPRRWRGDVHDALQRALNDDDFFQAYARKARRGLYSVALPHGFRAIIRIRTGGGREVLRLVARESNR